MPTQRFEILITNSDGTYEISSLAFGRAEPGAATTPVTVRINNVETAADITDARLFACRSDFLIEAPASEEAYVGMRAGEELVTKKWLEARIHGDTAWTPLDEYAHYLDLGSILREDYVVVDLRLNVPVGALSFGDIAFSLIVRSK